jgi:methylthioribose-1-phosphate isomerase
MRDRLLAAEKVKAIDWRDGALHLLDQRILPFEETWMPTRRGWVAEAIRSMVVRGAPAIGISAAYGLVLAARARIAEGGDWQAALEEDFALLADSRPTASICSGRWVACGPPRPPQETRRSAGCAGSRSHRDP